MDSPRRMPEMDDQIKAHNDTSANAGFRPTNGGIIKVQPPRREDMQPSYAQHLQGDDAETHGWYGAMGKFIIALLWLFIWQYP